MPRVRLPDEVHELTGSWDKNPNRRRPKAAKSEHPLGAPPKYFAPDERACWREIVAMSAAGVLTGADRWLIETACLVMAKQRRREEMKGFELSTLTFALSRAGMTPSDRSRIAAEKSDSKEENPFSEFLN